MSRFVALGSVALLFFTTTASALIFTPTQDNRATEVGSAVFGESPGFDFDSPLSSFSTFNSSIWSNSDYDGYFANGHASQDSQIGSMYIQGNGIVEAQIGLSFDNWLPGDKDAPTDMTDEMGAFGSSVLEILFSIDMDAQYDLAGFISAGVGLAQGEIDYGSEQSVRVELFDIDQGVALIDETVTDSDRDVATSGQIGPGNYRFTVSAFAGVFAGDQTEADSDGGGGGFPVPQGNIYTSQAGFEGINLTLSGRDQPIPEPVTASLACFGLGALVLQTSRRRRA